MNALTIVIIVAILILILILLRYVFYNPYTLQSLQNGETASVIPASSLATNGSCSSSSNFAYSIWFYINDWNYRYGEPKVLFGRMGAISDPSGGAIPGVGGIDPCPTVVLGSTQNDLMVALGCFPGVNNESQAVDAISNSSNTVVHNCKIQNIPIQKWLNLIISVYGRSLDVYMDGKLVKTCLLPGIANVNKNSDVYLTPGGGFSGWTAKFKYWASATDPQKAWNIYEEGYGASWFSNLFGQYQIQIKISKDGTETTSVNL
jgi:hypothetical protein